MSAGKEDEIFHRKRIEEHIHFIGIADDFLKGHVFPFGKSICPLHSGGTAAAVNGQPADISVSFRTQVLDLKPVVSGSGIETPDLRINRLRFRNNDGVIVSPRIQSGGKFRLLVDR